MKISLNLSTHSPLAAHSIEAQETTHLTLATTHLTLASILILGVSLSVSSSGFCSLSRGCFPSFPMATRKT